ncbi:MAG: tRNA glutamyl-Q(34) synthetase GluQRS [Deltaproteobacteria bacterium]|nr:tRNA glutamyl-Q(34) synthetase GluQRS [Deltaproteobacteria bacterium]
MHPDPSAPHSGRLAPSPTGILHVGNARSLALAWLAARAAGGRIYLRIEDLLPGQGPNIAPMLADLRWLGLDWDGPPADALWHPEAPLADEPPWCLQSARAPFHAAVLAALTRHGLVYPCVCTRKDIDLAARAPHLEDRGQAYPGTCRGRFASMEAALQFEQQRAAAEGRSAQGVALRLRVPGAELEFVDELGGPQRVSLPQTCGDIVVQRKDGGFAYMLAVVIDDLAMGIADVVRGDDLLEVTGQQLAVYAALAQVAELELRRPEQAESLRKFWERARQWRPPRHYHLPLVLGDDGRRLAKRNASLHLHSLRAAGVPAAALVRWIGESAGLGPAQTLAELVPRFAWSKLPRTPVRFGAKEFAELQGRAG